MKKKKQGRVGKFFGEFKSFITRGNILDMAVGVIVGGAFNTIVTTLNKKILMPVVDLALSCIPGMESGLYTILGNSKLADASTAADATVLGPDGKTYTVLNYIDWSAFIEAILNFFFIALTLFIIIKVASGLANKRKQLEEKMKKQEEEEKAQEPAPAPEPAPEPQPTEGEITIALLSEIRDYLKSEKKEGK